MSAPRARKSAFQANQPVEFDERITETVTLRAVLNGTAEVSPILWPNLLLCTGRIRTTGTYVTRAFEMGAAVNVRAIFTGQLPAGSSVAVDVDAADDIAAGQHRGQGTRGRVDGVSLRARSARGGRGPHPDHATGDAGARPILALGRAYSR
ncbi:MAG: hypothetical protein R3D43_15160 [Tepidamorphaceae bacterium]